MDKPYSYNNSKGQTYYLHQLEITLRQGKRQTNYYFAKVIKEGAIDSIPNGYVVTESRNGLPFLKKAK